MKDRESRTGVQAPLTADTQSLSGPLEPGNEPSATDVPTLADRGSGLRASWYRWASIGVIVLLSLLHTAGAWISMGGWKEMTSEWPISIHDHPVHFHSSVVSNSFLRQSGTTAGYDPSFMAGYPKNLIFPQSSTMFDVANFLLGGRWPAQVYKVVVFLALALVPWMIVLAGCLWGLQPGAIATAEMLVLLYGWTEGGGASFPWNYAWYGMSAYLLAVPLSVAAVATFALYVTRGGTLRWLAAALMISWALLTHITTPMLMGPAGLGAYLAAIWEARKAGRPLSRSRHAGVWTLPVVAIAVNAFWWYPAIWQISMNGDSAILFKHEESVVSRVLSILRDTPPIQAVLFAFALPGLVVLMRRNLVAGFSLAGLALAGFGWGYLAGYVRAVDFLQPGRHTYAFYAASSVATGVILEELVRRIRAVGGRADLWLILAMVLLSVRLFGPSLAVFVPHRLGWAEGSRPFLSSKPKPILLWILQNVRDSMKPGERLLYEEGGQSIEGEPDPFQDGRFSGLLPYLTGVEMLGGPYLKVSLKTNFTQFGEGKLFGNPNWDETFFRKYASIYRPTAILCWSKQAVSFCRSHPELIEPVDVLQNNYEQMDASSGRVRIERQEVFFGRIKGYEGNTVRGEAALKVSPGRLVVTSSRAEEPGGLVVLRYHFVPGITATPRVTIEPVKMGDDPVPFIGFRPSATPFSLKMRTFP